MADPAAVREGQGEIFKLEGASNTANGTAEEYHTFPYGSGTSAHFRHSKPWNVAALCSLQHGQVGVGSPVSTGLGPPEHLMVSSLSKQRPWEASWCTTLRGSCAREAFLAFLGRPSTPML
uniref:Uncharacterized protein n=1 Tax=Sphaerodactylus townsendi TaxID=933632 RepID=A0ACB8EMJ5_9SAUR